MNSADRMFEGITSGQKCLIDHWTANLGTDGKVARSQINPGEFCKDLANISIVDVRPNGRAIFRLAGSRLRDMFGRDVRGENVTRVMGTDGEAFQLTLEAAIARARPVGGVIKTVQGHHAWLRLPLVDSAGRLALVLCLDEVFKTESELKRSLGEPSNAAHAA